MADDQDDPLANNHETNQGQPKPDNAETLLAALPDEHLWRLLRRFNKVPAFETQTRQYNY
jgi:hypothetical protein